MREVSKGEFFAFIAANAKDDPMPSTECGDVTLWKNQKGQNFGRIVARSYPGWKRPGSPERYEISATGDSER